MTSSWKWGFLAFLAKILMPSKIDDIVNVQSFEIWLTYLCEAAVKNEVIRTYRADVILISKFWSFYKNTVNFDTHLAKYPIILFLIGLKGWNFYKSYLFKLGSYIKSAGS